MEIAILGAGTYGSYIVNSIQKKYPEANITVFDIGDNRIKNETEIGLLSRLKKSMYKGLTDGRYFGWGGASHKWGGQLLTYTDNDFTNPDGFMRDVISLDKKYKDQCLAKFNIENKFPENHVSEEMFTKTGVWLSMLHRNFFYWFKINKRENVKVMPNCRIVKLEKDSDKHIKDIVYLKDGKEKRASFDYYFLTTGAFESARILLSSDIIDGGKVHFSDHLSQRMFKIKGSTKIGNEDFVFRMRGTSLITKRMIGEIGDVSYYVHPVFNMKFPFFSMVKDVLFYHKFSIKDIPNYIKTTIKDIPNVFGFVWSVIFLRKMYVMNGEWYLYIDIENPTKDSYIELSEEKDKYGIDGLNVCYNVDEEAVKIYEAAKASAIKLLDSSNVNYEVDADKIDVQTCEDIYHPYGMLHFDSVDDYYTRWDNMLVVNTGCLTRSGGINPTASLFPVIDNFIFNKFNM